MCVRYVGVDLRAEKAAQRLLQLGFVYGDLAPQAEVFPGDQGLFAKAVNGQLVLGNGQWGLTPAWAKKPNYGRRHAYNARAEGSEERAQGIENMPTFRAAFKSRRGILPVESFYERSGGNWIRFVPKHDPFFLIAALWEEGHDSTQGLQTYTMVTTIPNAVVEPANDRMPVILDPESVADWTSNDAPIEALRALMVPCPEDWIELQVAEPVSRNRARTDTLPF